MKIILASPLYPPDIAFPAPYVKELAGRLSARKTDDSIEVVTYSDSPETIEGVTIKNISKRTPLIWRLISYTLLLAQQSKDATCIYMENGSSIELPVLLLSLTTGKKFILHFADERARAQAKRHLIRQFIEDRVAARAARIVTDTPLPRPEILPFSPYPEKQFVEYEDSWKKHLSILTDAFTYVTRS